MTDMPIVRTVLGDIDPTHLGRTYCHEHLIIDSKLIASEFPHIYLHDTKVAITEVQACKIAGVGTMLDCMPVSAGRQIESLVEIAQSTDIHVVSVTGLHHDRYYGPKHWSNRVSSEQLTDLFVADVTQGIDRFDYTSPIVERTKHCAGVIKVATDGGELDERDQRNLTAVAQAHIITGAPILTHCEDGLGAIQQVNGLVDRGVEPESIVLSHVDKGRSSQSQQDKDHLHAIARTGAYLEFDQALRQGMTGSTSSVRLVKDLFDHGFGDQIVMGTDGARRSLWRSLGGEPGLDWLAAHGSTELLNAGLSIEQIDQIFVFNPMKFLAFVPRLN
jgi:phosphotriesterase-related protein